MLVLYLTHWPTHLTRHSINQTFNFILVFIIPIASCSYLHALITQHTMHPPKLFLLYVYALRVCITCMHYVYASLPPRCMSAKLTPRVHSTIVHVGPTADQPPLIPGTK